MAAYIYMDIDIQIYIVVYIYIHIDIVELMDSHTITQSHLSSGSTVCFLPGGAAVHVLGMHPYFWKWDSPVSDVSLDW